MTEGNNLTEVLTFRAGDSLATIVTDGQSVRTYEWEHTAEHASLSRAIAYLEGKGYSIETDNFNGE